MNTVNFTQATIENVSKYNVVYLPFGDKGVLKLGVIAKVNGSKVDVVMFEGKEKKSYFIKNLRIMTADSKGINEISRDRFNHNDYISIVNMI